MSIEGIIFALVLATGVIALIAAPLLRREPAHQNAQSQLVDKQRERLQLYYERVLRNIRDLDEDYSLGKLDEASYRQEREEWAQRGVQVLKALDSLTGESMIAATSTEDAAVDSAIDDAIEAAIKSYRARSTADRVVE